MPIAVQSTSHIDGSSTHSSHLDTSAHTQPHARSLGNVSTEQFSKIFLHSVVDTVNANDIHSASNRLPCGLAFHKVFRCLWFVCELHVIRRAVCCFENQKKKKKPKNSFPFFFRFKLIFRFSCVKNLKASNDLKTLLDSTVCAPNVIHFPEFSNDITIISGSAVQMNRNNKL